VLRSLSGSSMQAANGALGLASIAGQQIQMVARPGTASATSRPATPGGMQAPTVLTNGTDNSKTALDADNANTLLFGDFLCKKILGAVKGAGTCSSKEVVGKAFRHLHKGQVHAFECQSGNAAKEVPYASYRAGKKRPLDAFCKL
jgi:hypothetical protein